MTRDRDEDPKARKAREMEKMREEWGDNNKKGGGDESYCKLAEGKNHLRVLPRLDDKGNIDEGARYFEMYAMHYGVGPEGKDSFRCIEPKGPFGHSKKLDKDRNYRAKLCPECITYCRNKSKARKIEFGSPEGKKFWGDYVAPHRARYQYVMAVTKPKSKKYRKKALVLRCGQQIGKPLAEAFYDEDGVDFTHIKTGVDMKITKTQLSKKATDVEYTLRFLPAPSELMFWSRLKKRLPDLKTFLPEKLEPDAIRAIIEGDGTADDDEVVRDRKRKKKRDRGGDNDDADLDDVDDEDAEHKLKLARRKREKDEDVDPDAEEEPDEAAERRARRKKKKQKIRERLAKKAQKDKG